MSEDKLVRGLYETIGRALSAAETSFYEELEANDIDIIEREIWVKMTVFEKEDTGNEAWDTMLMEVSGKRLNLVKK